MKLDVRVLYTTMGREDYMMSPKEKWYDMRRKENQEKVLSSLPRSSLASASHRVSSVLMTHRNGCSHTGKHESRQEVSRDYSVKDVEDNNWYHLLMYTHSPFPVRKDHGCQKERRVLGPPGFVSLKSTHKYISRLAIKQKSTKSQSGYISNKSGKTRI